MNTKKKSVGLAAFGAKTQTVQNDVMTQSSNVDNATSSKAVNTPSSKEGKTLAKTVACTVRLPRSAWLQVQHLALDEGTSFQALAVAGLEAELKRRGLKGFDKQQ